MGLEWRRLGAALHQAEWGYLLPAAGALLAYLLARSARWRVLLGSSVGLGDAFAVTNIGYLVSNVLPFRLGDPARAVAIGLGGEVKISAALSTVVVERVLDMLMVVLLLAATIPSVEEAGWARGAGMIAGAAALAASMLLVVLALRPDVGRAASRWVLASVPFADEDRWMEPVEGLLEGLTALRSVRQSMSLLGWSLLTWMLIVGYYWAVLWAFLDRPPLAAGSFLTCATGLGMAVPSSPGAVGVFHSVARYALQVPFQVPVEKAVVVAFASHGFQYSVMCLLGLVGLVRQNLSLRQLQTTAAAAAEE